MAGKVRLYMIALGSWPVRIYPDDEGNYPEGEKLQQELEERLTESLMQSQLVLDEDMDEYDEEED